MRSQPLNMTFEIELEEGEALSLPAELVANVGAGRWIVTVQPFEYGDPRRVVRDHAAFLNGYAPEDEGLYDDDAAG